MSRALVVAALAFVTSAAASQQSGVLVRVVLADAAGRQMAVARHVLLVSDDPPSAPPRRFVTAPDGTVTLNLPAGTYIVESDQPVVFQGRAYSWAQIVEVPAGGRTAIELTAANARVGSPGAAAVAAADKDGSDEVDPSSLLVRWEQSVVAIWTPTAHASGLVTDRRGLVVTSQRAVGTAASVEVQLTPTTKVPGQVLLSDPGRDVAVVRIASSALSLADTAPVCAGTAAPPFVIGQELFAIHVPLRGMRDVASGTVRSVAPQAVLADLRLERAGAGGPVFAADGRLAGISSAMDAADERLAGTTRVVRLDEACDAIRSVEPRMTEDPPDGTPLPTEPAKPFPPELLAAMAAKRAGSLRPSAMSSPDFDITFITPVHAYAALWQSDRRTMSFSNWSDYVADTPPVLLIRVTPRQVESFWVTLARGAAWTQGAALPPIKHFKAGFARLRAWCGEAEVTPIHPFRLELRLSETEATYEGLSVFDPGALGPHCGRVRLELYSEQAGDQGHVVEVDSAVLLRIREDFDPYRALP